MPEVHVSCAPVCVMDEAVSDTGVLGGIVSTVRVRLPEDSEIAQVSGFVCFAVSS